MPGYIQFVEDKTVDIQHKCNMNLNEGTSVT